ncbi:SLo interacting protein 1 [Cochliomyia hominivorax]
MANVNFVVLKINNINVCELPHQQRKTVLNMLLNEQTDNIVLELKRKSCWNSNIDLNYDDIELSKKLCYLKIHHNNPYMDNIDDVNSATTIASDIIVNLHLPNSTLQQYCIAKSTQTDDIAFYVHEHLRNIQKDTERLIEHEHNLFEQSLAPEIDIEEITLRKSDSNERLGITVCYSNAEDYTDGGCSTNVGGEIYNDALLTEVYISDIHPDSVAGRDGRLRQGDQILQINGKDIKTRPETETLIAENNNAVTLLVSRYLYADEDDFNDPSTNEDDDEVLVVEDEEDEDEDDDEFYDENNMTYVNCVINNDCVNSADELDKALMSQVVQQEQMQQNVEKPQEKCNISNFTSTIHLNPAYQSNNIKCTSDIQKEKLPKNDRKFWLTGSANNKGGKQVKSGTAKSDVCQGDKSHEEYETEHIYETIPEDPESEPFYCSPYDSSVYVTAMTSCATSTITDALQNLQQKQRVAQWLGIKPLQEICTTTAPRQFVRNSNGGGRSSAFFNKSVTGTVRSAVTTFTNESVDCLVNNVSLPVNSQLEDQDNSSSAYNTGGSNNSVCPLTLMMNPKNRPDQTHTIPTFSVNSTSNGTADDGYSLQQMHQKNSLQQKTHSPKDKSKITSPKGSTFQHKSIAATHKMPVDSQMPGNVLDKNSISKETNVHRNMLIKQHLFNQKYTVEKSMQPYPVHQTPQCYYQQPSDQIQCPQFTAPNLSQYHFVSSKEVNNLSLKNETSKPSTTGTTIINNPKKEEETMVWKVKRRPDGTRYIVRRPAKSRVIKERNTRLNVERLRNDITTTEDDTISEIKTGRYWTREERKKHIEKARERRQQQSKSHLTYDDSTLCIGDTGSKIFQDTGEREKIRQLQYQYFIQQQQKASHQQQQHYQLQFNSAEDRKHSAPLHNMESPTKKSSSTVPTTSEDVSTVKPNIDQSDILNSVVFTSSEHNQVNNSLQSVTTT